MINLVSSPRSGKLAAAALPFLCLAGVGRMAFAAPADIVSRSSSLYDDLARLTRAGSPAGNSDQSLSAADFQGDTLWTRAQMARQIERILDDTTMLHRVQRDDRSVAALLDASEQLSPELTFDGYHPNFDDLPAAPGFALVSGTVSAIEHADGSSDTPSRTQGYGGYRETPEAVLSRNARVVLSASDWARDSRKVFNNDLGPRDFSDLSEAYLDLTGRHGLSFQIGRLADRWGAGYHGATLLSDNSPPFDQARVSFPFSFGKRGGRNYQFTQMATVFKQQGQSEVFEARRIEYAFNRHWNVDFEEAFKSSQTGTLFGSALPLNLQMANFPSLDKDFNYTVNLSASYAKDADTRIYSQFFVDDFKNPLGAANKVVPRKLAFLLGFAAGSPSASSIVAEYSQADPTTYTFQNNGSAWQHGDFDQIGLPEGPNNRTFYLRVSRRISPKLTMAVDGRERRRMNDSYPAPTSTNLGLTATYKCFTDQAIGIGYHHYRQDPFPTVAPDAQSAVAPAVSDPYVGSTLRIHEWDFSYHLFF